MRILFNEFEFREGILASFILVRDADVGMFSDPIPYALMEVAANVPSGRVAQGQTIVVILLVVFVSEATEVCTASTCKNA